MERYIGLDAHGQSCTFAVMGPSGRRIRHDVVETNGAALVRYVKALAGRKHLCLEEGTQSAWLYEILSPHVEEILVAGIHEKNHGSKSDVLDAFQRAEELRTNQVRTPVFKAPRRFSSLRELSRVHTMLVRDVVRVQSRLKATYRARGIPTPGKTLYRPGGRQEWLSKLPVSCRAATARLYEAYDALLELKSAAEKEMVTEAAKQPIAKVLATAPGMGPIRVAQLLPVVVTPERFRTRKQFWSYCGLSIVLRSSSDWVRSEHGGWVRARVAKTRGLNRNHNSRLKGIFKGAATTVLTSYPDDPLHEHYQQLTADGTKPNLAKLTLARRIAAVVLRMWKDGKEYDPQTLRAKQQEEIASPAR
ncbi:MAG: transposase [Planctomycetota bacterium]|jgi:transposase